MGLPVSEVLRFYDQLTPAEQRKVLEVALEPNRLLHALVPEFFYEREGREGAPSDFEKWLEKRHPALSKITRVYGAHNIANLFASHCDPPELEAVSTKGAAHERVYKGRE